MSQEPAPDMVARLADALRALPEITTPAGLAALPAALRSGAPGALSQEDLASIEAGIAALARPVEDRAPWPTARSRGLFFVFEGLDRSGKSTQSKKLLDRLQKQRGEEAVQWMCFPNRKTAIGSLINLYLRREIELPDGVVHLLFSANRWEMAQSIVDALNRGVSIVCDRYAFSGVAYSAAKGLDFDWCQAPDIGLPCPDGVFFMKVDPEVGASRSDFGDERYENKEMQARVRAEFALDRIARDVPWRVVDGARDIETIHQEICEQAEDLATAEQENDTKPIHRLWMPRV